MGAKKKKGGRRISKDDFAEDDAILADILTGSSYKGAVPNGSVPSGNPASPPSLPTNDSVKDPILEKSEKAIKTDDSSTATTGSEELTAPQSKTGKDGKCQHIKNAIKLPKFRKGLGQQKDWDHCQGCINAEIKTEKRIQRLNSSLVDLSLSNADSSTEALPAESLWMCLTCCEINCGRAIKEHALAHNEEKKNNHPLAMNLGNMDCWCYDCDDQVVPGKNRNQVIQECQTTFEKILQIKQAKMIAASAATSKKTKGSHSTTTTAVAVTATTPKAKVFTPGLQNLGNTCFFNSVAQVLTETRSLRTVLSDTGNESAVFPKSLAASTDAGLGPLTTNLKEFLSTMWKQQGGTVAPREIFTQITKKWKVFRGFKQQDSQELMRYLFDGIKQEELDMIKRQLANEAEEEKKFNSQGSTEDDTEDSTEEADSEKKEAENVPKYVPFIDSCFSGKLVSVIVCDACKKCSYAPEDFFDLSLPVRGLTQSGLSARSSLKARFVASKQASVATEAGPSSISEFSLDEKDPIPELEKPSEAHMRHVEKMLRNIGSSDSETLSIQRSLNQFTSVDCLDDDNKFACENCFELIRGSKQNGEASAEQPEDQEGEKEGSDEDKRDQEGDKEGSDEDKGDQESIPEADKIEESTRKQDKNHASNSGMESQSDDGEEGNEQADRFGNSIPTKTSTAAAKKPAKKEEEEKYIFRKAYKRYLISQLPPTLVLHLKRFEQSGRFGLMRKIEDHVDIPVELDMSPYFLPKSEIEDEDEDHEHSQDDGLSKKYRLYGAVVHMGTLAGGHYTNYVLSSKVALPEASKPAVEEKEKINKKSIMDVNGYELPDVSLAVISAQQKEGKKTKGSSASLASVDIAGSDKDVVDAAAGEQREEEEVIDNRQWIACSDTSVRLSSLQDVLASRAYLLFYERC